MTIKDRIITPGPTEAAKQERPVTLDDVLGEALHTRGRSTDGLGDLLADTDGRQVAAHAGRLCQPS